MSPLEARRQMNLSREVSRSRSTNLESKISQMKETSDLELMNTSIWVLNMIPPLVFSDLISILFSLELERECPREEQEPTDSDNSKESPKKTLSNGSLKLLVDPSFEQVNSFNQ